MIPINVLRELTFLSLLQNGMNLKQVDLAKVKKLLKDPVIVDGRNIYHPEKVKELGFQYFGVGR